MTRARLVAALAIAIAVGACGGSGSAADAKAPRAAASAPAPPPCPARMPEGKADPATAAALVGKKIVRVCVVGPRGAALAAAEKAVVAKPGDPLGEGRAREDLRAALATGLFEDGAAWAEPAGDGVVLLFDLKERPRVASIAFDGAKVFGDDALAAKVPFEKNGPFDPAKMAAVARALEDEYRARGYLACGVRWVARPSDDGTVALKVSVLEGPLHRFAKIAFRGNARVPSSELLTATELHQGEPYTRDKVERAGLALQAAYFDRGMVQAKIEATPEEASDAAGVTFTIDEGPVFSVGKVAIGKDGKKLEKDLLAVMKTKPGQTFSRKAVLADIDRVSRVLGEKDLHGEMTPNTELDAKKKTIDVTIDVTFR